MPSRARDSTRDAIQLSSIGSSASVAGNCLDRAGAREVGQRALVSLSECRGPHSSEIVAKRGSSDSRTWATCLHCKPKQCTTKIMKAKKKRTTKKRGPKPTGKALPMRQLRMSKEQAAAVTTWAARQEDKPNWSEAVRRLVEQSLSASQPPTKRSKQAASKAREMAGQELERVADRSLSVEVRESRKRRLTKGPTEFRDMRDDLPKAKG